MPVLRKNVFYDGAVTVDQSDWSARLSVNVDKSPLNIIDGGNPTLRGETIQVYTVRVQYDTTYYDEDADGCTSSDTDTDYIELSVYEAEKLFMMLGDALRATRKDNEAHRNRD